MSHRSARELALKNADNQEQSLFFSGLPLDIRRHIYLQLWLDSGINQHIYLFGPSSFLSHYPCLLEKSAYEPHRPPSPPAPSEPQESAETATEDDAQLTSTEGAAENDQGEDVFNAFHDDPGDIDDAIRDIAALHPQPAPPPSDNTEAPWADSPWCMHKECFTAYMATYSMSFARAYSANYHYSRHSPSAVGLAKPLLVCGRMYQEAGESLYTSMTFSFPDLVVLEQFMQQVPRALSARIQVADVMLIASVDGTRAPELSASFAAEEAVLPLAAIAPRIFAVLANVRDLRLCLHVLRKHSGTQRQPLPSKQWFEPLYRLSEELKKRNLRKLSVQLVTRCDGKGGHHKAEWLTYGSTPKHMEDAPFSVALVPRGFHADSDCCAYWVDQDGEHEEDQH